MVRGEGFIFAFFGGIAGSIFVICIIVSLVTECVRSLNARTTGNPRPPPVSSRSNSQRLPPPNPSPSAPSSPSPSHPSPPPPPSTPPPSRPRRRPPQTHHSGLADQPQSQPNVRAQMTRRDEGRLVRDVTSWQQQASTFAQTDTRTNVSPDIDRDSARPLAPVPHQIHSRFNPQQQRIVVRQRYTTQAPPSLSAPNLAYTQPAQQPQHTPHNSSQHATFSLDDLESFEVMDKHKDSPCPICLGPLEEEPISCGQCLHFAHISCLKSWLVKDAKTACPVCRVRFTDGSSYVAVNGHA